jgi:hypothetical protein
MPCCGAGCTGLHQNTVSNMWYHAVHGSRGSSGFLARTGPVRSGRARQGPARHNSVLLRDPRELRKAPRYPAPAGRVPGPSGYLVSLLPAVPGGRLDGAVLKRVCPGRTRHPLSYVPIRPVPIYAATRRSATPQRAAMQRATRSCLYHAARWSALSRQPPQNVS